jgi:hypothetical protein
MPVCGPGAAREQMSGVPCRKQMTISIAMAFTRPDEYADNDRRFIFFCRAVFSAAKALNFQPDILHAHRLPHSIYRWLS